MKTVQQLLDGKGKEVWTVRPDDTVFYALGKMAEKEIGALVVAEGEKILGILSERDYARKVILKGASSRETKVKEIMTREVVFVSPDRTAEECLALMTGKRCRHLPVLEGRQMVGLVSIGDAVKAVIADKEFRIGQLENYIMTG